MPSRIEELRRYAVGWLNYFGISHTYTQVLELPGEQLPPALAVDLRSRARPAHGDHRTRPPKTPRGLRRADP